MYTFSKSLEASMRKLILFSVVILSLITTACGGGGGGGSASGGANVQGITPASAISTVSAN
jgi:hypothetical protein